MWFKVFVTCLGDKLPEYWVDSDRFSLVELWNDTKWEILKLKLYKGETMDVHVSLPWEEGKRIKVEDDKTLLDVFSMFEERKIKNIHMDVDFLPFSWEHDEILVTQTAPSNPEQSQSAPSNPKQSQTAPSNPNNEPCLETIPNNEPENEHIPTHEPTPNEPATYAANDDEGFDPHERFEWTDEEDDAKGVSVEGNVRVEHDDDSAGSDIDLSDFELEAEGLPIGSDSEADEGIMDKVSRSMSGKVFKDPKPHMEIKLELHQVFDDVKELRRVLDLYAVQEGFVLIKIKNDNVRVTACCGNKEDCPWRIHASALVDGITFKIKTLNNEHSCQRVTDNGLGSVQHPFFVRCERLATDILFFS